MAGLVNIKSSKITISAGSFQRVATKRCGIIIITDDSSGFFAIVSFTPNNAEIIKTYNSKVTTTQGNEGTINVYHIPNDICIQNMYSESKTINYIVVGLY